LHCKADHYHYEFSLPQDQQPHMNWYIYYHFQIQKDCRNQ
jgi:hypothetical protein